MLNRYKHICFLVLFLFFWTSGQSFADNTASYEERIKKLEDRLSDLDEDKMSSVQSVADFIERLNMEVKVGVWGCMKRNMLTMPGIQQTSTWTPSSCISNRT